MSAEDNLNPQQFMSADDLGTMKSQYNDPESGRPLTLDEAYHRPDVRFNDTADATARKSGWRDGQQRHTALKQSIRAEGIKNSIFYDPNAKEVSAGHHRYFAGRDEGLTQFPVNAHDRKERYQNVKGFD